MASFSALRIGKDKPRQARRANIRVSFCLFVFFPTKMSSLGSRCVSTRCPIGGLSRLLRGPFHYWRCQLEFRRIFSLLASCWPSKQLKLFPVDQRISRLWDPNGRQCNTTRVCLGKFLLNLQLTGGIDESWKKTSLASWWIVSQYLHDSVTRPNGSAN